MPYQYLLMSTRGGLAVHLAEARSSTALCGTPVTLGEWRVPFASNGCRRCARTAIKAGTDHVVDVDQARVDLRAFLADRA